MKISVTTYSFWQLINAGKMTQADCVRVAHEMGFDGIEFTDIAGDTFEEQCRLAKKIRADADALGMPIVSYAISACMYQPTKEASDAEVERVCRKVDIAKILGAPAMRHDMTFALGKSGDAVSFDRMLPTMAENTRRITEYAEKQGIVTMTENHGMISQDSERVERIWNAVAHDNFKLLIDIGNFACADEDSFLAVARLAPYARHVHAKDFAPAVTDGFMTRGGRRIRGAVIGEGFIPVVPCLRALMHAGYDGYITVEYEGSEDPLAAIARGKANLEALLKQAKPE